MPVEDRIVFERCAAPFQSALSAEIRFLVEIARRAKHRTGNGYILFHLAKARQAALMCMIFHKTRDCADFKGALNGACAGGHVDILQDIIAESDLYYKAINNDMPPFSMDGEAEMVAPLQSHDFNVGLFHACVNGHPRILDYLGIPEDALGRGLVFLWICRSRNLAAIKEGVRRFGLSWGSGGDVGFWGRALFEMARCGWQDVVEYLIEAMGLFPGFNKEAPARAENMTAALYGACLGKHMDLAKWLITHGAPILSIAGSRDVSAQYIELLNWYGGGCILNDM